jgi:hypothetical protein
MPLKKAVSSQNWTELLCNKSSHFSARIAREHRSSGLPILQAWLMQSFFTEVFPTNGCFYCWLLSGRCLALGLLVTMPSVYILSVRWVYLKISEKRVDSSECQTTKLHIIRIITNKDTKKRDKIQSCPCD